MPHLLRAAVLAVASLAAAGCTPAPARSDERDAERAGVLRLARPLLQGEITVEQAIAQRRSRREFGSASLSLGEIGQLCWSAQGVTGEGGLRAVPSAGALHPLELHVSTADGLFHYDPARHALHRIHARDVRPALRGAAHGQEAVGDAPLVLSLSAVEARTAARYGERAARYVALEAGHAAQNVLLAAEALDLAAVPVGAFDDDEVRRALELDDDATPLYLVPVGRRL